MIPFILFDKTLRFLLGSYCYSQLYFYKQTKIIIFLFCHDGSEQSKHTKNRSQEFPLLSYQSILRDSVPCTNSIYIDFSEIIYLSNNGNFLSHSGKNGKIHKLKRTIGS